MLYFKLVSYLVFLILIFIEVAVGPLQTWVVLTITITGFYALYLTFPRQFRDEMDGMIDMALLFSSLAILVAILASWWYSQGELIRFMAQSIAEATTSAVTKNKSSLQAEHFCVRLVFTHQTRIRAF